MMTMERALSTEVETVEKYERKSCPYEIGTQEHTYDACCTVRAEVSVSPLESFMKISHFFYLRLRTAVPLYLTI